MVVRIAETDADLRAAYPVMAQLRTDLTEESFVERAGRQMRGGYRVATLEEDGSVRAVAGFRITETLFSGKHMYVDDLVTEENARSTGLGAKMLAWLADHARSESCEMLELDSGVQRADAHRFYFRHGMHVASFRFRRSL